jgi:hypothetical protein
MGGKHMEGDAQQLRNRARDAKRKGRLASEQSGTKGASKQRRHLPTDEDHVAKLEAIRQGKQPDAGIHVSEPEPRPGYGA